MLDTIPRKKASAFSVSWQKRAFDILFSGFVLLLGLPLFLCIALCIKWTSPGPIFYCSLRLGKNGELFKFWKFRSMHQNADKELHKILSQDPSLQEEWKKFFKLKNDPRITRVGKFLRRTSLDELPQFWNILVGDLSIVGPRPFLPSELPAIKDLLGSDFEAMLAIRPGLTGIWQTSGRSTLSFEERVLLDITYLKKSSFSLDLGIIGKTIPLMLFPKGSC